MGPFAMDGSTTSPCWVISASPRATARRAAARAGSIRSRQCSPSTALATSLGHTVLSAPRSASSRMSARSRFASISLVAPLARRRQAALQYLTSAQSRAHFFRRRSSGRTPCTFPASRPILRPRVVPSCWRARGEPLRAWLPLGAVAHQRHPARPSCNAAAMLPESGGADQRPGRGYPARPRAARVDNEGRRRRLRRDGKAHAALAAGLLRRRPGRPEPLRRNFGPRDAGRTSTIAASSMSGRQGKPRATLRPRHTLELSSRRNFGPRHTGRCSSLTQVR